MLCSAMVCYAMLCDAMLCCAILDAMRMTCYAMLCCAILDARGRRVSPFTIAFPMEFLHFGIQGGAACLRSPLLFLWNSYILASGEAPRVSVHPCFALEVLHSGHQRGAVCLRSRLLS